MSLADQFEKLIQENEPLSLAWANFALHNKDAILTALRGRDAVLEEAAKVCDEESSKRDHRANNPLPGDENLPDQNCAMVQAHKALTASMLATAIRDLK